jgi:hypothetical protein
MEPEKFVEKYHHLIVSPLRFTGSTPPILADMPLIYPITAYRSGLSKYRQQVREAIRNFLKSKASKSGSGVTVSGHGWSIDGPAFGRIPYFSDWICMWTLSGKGTPEEISSTMSVASLMLHERAPNKALLGCPDLATFRDWYMGLDCNGLIFAYLRSYFGWTETEDHKPRWYTKGIRRKKLDEIRERDFVFKWEGVDHIALIGKIWSRDASSIECNLCEARSPDAGGAQVNRWRIWQDGSHFQSKQLTGGSGTRTLDEVWRSPAIP